MSDFAEFNQVSHDQTSLPTLNLIFAYYLFDEVDVAWDVVFIYQSPLFVILLVLDES